MGKNAKKIALVQDEQSVSLYDVNVSAPEFFEVPVDATPKEAAEFVARAAAFIGAMRALDRIVMVGLDDNDEPARLYLSSVEESPELK